MRRVVIPLLAALSLGACAGGYGGGGGGVAYEAYYDGFYGPYYDGYWGSDDAYYYSPGEGRPFVRDSDHHFHRGAADGFKGVHGRGGPHPPALAAAPPAGVRAPGVNIGGGAAVNVGPAHIP